MSTLIICLNLNYDFTEKLKFFGFDFENCMLMFLARLNVSSYAWVWNQPTTVGDAAFLRSNHLSQHPQNSVKTVYRSVLAVLT